MITVAALYRFARFADPAAIRGALGAVCVAQGIKGTLLIAREGINGTIAGSKSGVDAVIAHIRTLPDCTVCEKFGVGAYLPPWSLSAAAVQAAATVGIIYIVP